VVVSQIARRNDYKLSFMDFTRYGAVFTVFSLLVSTVYVFVRYFYLA
jgi:Na+/H+ antiporter NhaD/arsenite permease-like protein